MAEFIFIQLKCNDWVLKGKTSKIYNSRSTAIIWQSGGQELSLPAVNCIRFPKVLLERIFIFKSQVQNLKFAKKKNFF